MQSVPFSSFAQRPTASRPWRNRMPTRVGTAPPPRFSGEAPLAPQGLSEAEAANLLAQRPPFARPATSRSYASIVRANVFTIFNLILLVFGVVTLAFGDWRDALFLGVLVSNSAIGIVQEVRAKHALDRLAALVAPTATVVRDGKERRAHVEELVVRDLVRLAPGDQVVADGTLETSDVLRLDESILTGESRPVARGRGDGVRSGSFAVEGSGSYRVAAVGPESYAERIAGEARAFRHPRSPLERTLNRLLLTLLAVIVPLGLLLGAALWERRTPIEEAVPTSVAAVVSLIPEGLILLVSLTYAVAALRMARKGALVQQLNAVESLASVDVVCLDKTGTLTEGGLRLAELIPAEGVAIDDVREQLGVFAASSPTRNATLTAIGSELSADAMEPESSVPFSSRWRWSGLTHPRTITSPRLTRPFRARTASGARRRRDASRPPRSRLCPNGGSTRSGQRRARAASRRRSGSRRSRRALAARGTKHGRVLQARGSDAQGSLRR